MGWWKRWILQDCPFVLLQKFLTRFLGSSESTLMPLLIHRFIAYDPRTVPAPSPLQCQRTAKQSCTQNSHQPYSSGPSKSFVVTEKMQKHWGRTCLIRAAFPGSLATLWLSSYTGRRVYCCTKPMTEFSASWGILRTTSLGCNQMAGKAGVCSRKGCFTGSNLP